MELKNVQKCEEKDPFYAGLMIHLTVQSIGAPEGTFDGAPTDAQKCTRSAFEVPLKGALEVAHEMHLWLYLLMHSLIHKGARNNSSKGGPDDLLESALNGALNVGLE